EGGMLARDVAEDTVRVRPALDRPHRARVAVEVVGEPIVGRDEFGASVAVDVGNRRARARIAPEVHDRGVRTGGSVPEIDTRPRAAVRTGRVELEHHLRLAVAVEV